jgi:NAD(P)-dependent dehydrogenase (short-subunit alcohol dehydrogenase family)
MTYDLTGRVVMVTGASKGIGKGIALELGACGATVFVTARSADALDETAAEIGALGGTGVSRPCDHTDDDQARALFDEVARDYGTLDVLVNNASPDFSGMVGHRFWDISFDALDACLDVGPRSAYVASALAARQMIHAGKHGLIVNVSSHGSSDYILSVPYGIGKAGLDKLTHDAALELRDHGITMVSLWPGLVRTERLNARAVTDDEGRPRVEGLDLDAIGESPRFSGRAVAALATDPDVAGRAGRCFFASRLAREYGFTDLDGSLPPEIRNLASYLGEENVPGYWKIVNPFPEVAPA